MCSPGAYTSLTKVARAVSRRMRSSYVKNGHRSRTAIDFNPRAVGDGGRGFRHGNDGRNTEFAAGDGRVRKHAAALDDDRPGGKHEEQPAGIGFARDEDAVLSEVDGLIG